jgi:hypothetical protein
MANKINTEPTAVYNKNKYIALTFRKVDPHIPIIKIIGINIISKKKKNNNKSKLKKVPKIANSRKKKKEKYSLKKIISLKNIEKKHRGKIKAVNRTKIIENPSTPNNHCKKKSSNKKSYE